MISRLITLLGVAILAASLNGQAAQPRLSRTNLLLCFDDSGKIQAVRSPLEWQRRLEAIKKGMTSIMGPVPGQEKRCPLNPQVTEEVDCGSYIRQFLTYESEPGGRVPAYLLVPKAARSQGMRAPAVLTLHQTHAAGHKTVVGLGHSPNDEYGVELAKRGFVALAPAYPLLAEYHPDLKALGYRSGTMKAVWDNMRGLDYLESLPFVKTNGFAAIGHSLGGHNSVYTAVFDPRIKAVVSSCGLDAFVDYKNGDIRGWTSERYMPRLLEYRERLEEIPFDFPELIGALAPRGCFISAPLGDTNFRWESVDRIAAAARPVYQLFGAGEKLRVEHPDCGHVFPKEMREQAYRLIEAELQTAY